MKTNASRPPKVNAAIRAGAALCVFVGVIGTALCSAERACICADVCAGMSHAQSADDHDAVAVPQEGHSNDAGHHHDDVEAQEQSTTAHEHEDATEQDGHGCAASTCGDGTRCCSTIQAFVTTPTPLVITKTVSQPALIIFLLCGTRGHTLAKLAHNEFRQAKPRDWIFTPELCLGPANRTHAPPASA